MKIIGSGGGGKGGGGGGGTPHEDKDNLDSKSFARILDLIGEGEISGLVDGAKSIFFNNTPLQAADGSFNFKDVSFETRTGTSSQTVIPVTRNVATTKTVAVLEQPFLLVVLVELYKLQTQMLMQFLFKLLFLLCNNLVTKEIFLVLM